MALVFLAGCSNSGGAAACRDAASAQAIAEQAWASAIEAHNGAHASELLDHPDLEEQLMTGRIEVIITTEETRKACS